MHFLIEHPIVIQLFVFGVVVAAVVAFSMIKPGYAAQIESRVRQLRTGSEAPLRVPGKLAALTSKIPQLTESVPGNAKHRRQLQKVLLEAGIYQPWGLTLYVSIRLSLMIVLPLVCFAVAQLQGLPPIIAPISGAAAAIIGFCLPHVWLERRRAARHMTLRRSIPDFLDLIVACLSGGLSVQAALRQVADELVLAHADLSSELNRVLREIELGGTLDHALQQLAQRTGMDEFRTLRSFIHQTTKFGTTITDALASLAEMLRMQREQRAEELAQKAAVKILLPTFLFIFPTIFVVLAGPAALQIKEGFAASTYQNSGSKQQK